MSGYKLTEIGVIPEDWHFKYIGEVAQVTTGNRNTQDRVGDGQYPFFVRSQTVERINSYSFDGEAVLTAGDGVGTGKVFHYIKGRFDVHQRVYRISNFSEHINGYFFYLYFSANFYNRIMQMTAKSSVDSVRMQMITRMAIPIPTLSEQCAIATALSDMDALLDGVTSLIAKKRNFKQAIMQQLLTGQTRLPGFSGKWEVKTIQELAQVGRGRVISHAEISRASSPDYPVYSSQTYNNGVMGYLDTYDFEGDYITWTTDGANAGTVFARSGRFNCTNVCGTIRLNGSDHKFVAAALARVTQPHVSRQLGNPKLMNDVMKKIEIKIPKSLEEQTAIATVLSDMDAELAVLEARLAKTQALKQAMMQELLTGKTRLVDIPSNVVSGNFNKKSKVEPNQKPATKSHNWAINEAVVVAVLAKHFGSEQFPLGRKRCTKLAYLMHRHAEHVAEGYLKKAAGPYNPAVKYKGPEGIAQKNGYIRAHANGKFSGFVAAENIAKAEDYFEKWYGRDVLDWLEKFRRNTNDDLELLATVDMAMQEIQANAKRVDLPAVKAIISNHPEWEAKLDREIFSDINIGRAIPRVKKLFPAVDNS